MIHKGNNQKNLKRLISIDSIIVKIKSIIRVGKQSESLKTILQNCSKGKSERKMKSYIKPIQVYHHSKEVQG